MTWSEDCENIVAELSDPDTDGAVVLAAWSTATEIITEDPAALLDNRDEATIFCRKAQAMVDALEELLA